MEPNDLLTIISNEYQEILGENLCGIYLHGSLAFGCFHWNKSDIDFLVVVYENISQGQKEALIQTFQRLNPTAPPKGFEMSVVLYRDCRDFHYPTPFQLHYSNAHIRRITDDLSNYCRSMNGNDCDLAAHFTVVREVGVVLFGKPISDVFGEVPKHDYLASIKSDVQEAENEVVSNPVYMILNLCRVLAYIKSGLVLSKLDGGQWGLTHLSEEYRDLIQNALDCYCADKEVVFDANKGQQFARDMIRNIFS